MLEEWIIGNGTSVVEAGVLLDKYLAMGRWHRSRERKGGYHPFGSYMMNKKWTMEEEFNNHMLRFQEVRDKSFELTINLSSVSSGRS